MVVCVDIHIFFLYFHAVRDLFMATTSQRRKYNNDPVTQISSATYVASSLCRDRGATSVTLSRRCTLLTLKYHLKTKTEKWAPHKVCKAVLKLCDHGLRERTLSWSLLCQWFEENQQTIWITARYFKFVDAPGFNKKTKQHLQYHIPYARQSVALCEEIPVPLFTELPEIEGEALSSPACTGEDDETDLLEPSGADCDRLSLCLVSLNWMIWSEICICPNSLLNVGFQTAREKTAETWH